MQKIDSISFDNFKPDFRSIAALNAQTIFLLNAGSPVYLLKTTDKGLHWKTVYQNPDTAWFFDAIKFRDQQSGAALADPIDGCFKIIITNDGGESWAQLPCIETLKSNASEACFAASNSSWDFYKKHIWIATGGKSSRIFHSSDYGSTFSVTPSPITGGTELRGIFSIDFFDDKTGVISGGNYDSTATGDTAFAFTTDGGKTWTTPSHEKNFFGSCVQIVKRGKEKIFQ